MMIIILNSSSTEFTATSSSSRCAAFTALGQGLGRVPYNFHDDHHDDPQRNFHPQGYLKSETFQRGGHGFSLHVRTFRWEIFEWEIFYREIFEWEILDWEIFD